MAFIALLMWMGSAWAAPQTARSHPGYIQTMDEELNMGISEEIVLPAAPEDDQPPLSKRIFNDQLTKEFNQSYRQAFGQTEAEQNYNQPSKITEATMQSGPSREASLEDDRRREFGQYMLRRLAEYHIDNYAKNDPQVRPAWEFKERISQVNAEVAPGYKLNGKYSISGNLFELKIENPFVRSKAIIEFGSTGPSHQQETTFDIGRDITETIAMSALYRVNKDQVSLVGTKELGPGLTASLTGSSANKKDVEGRDGEKLILAGLSWNY